VIEEEEADEAFARQKTMYRDMPLDAGALTAKCAIITTIADYDGSAGITRSINYIYP